MANKKTGVGRPNAIETIIKPLIKNGKLLEYASDPNLSKKKIAKLIGVSYSTLMDAQKQFPELLDIFQKGKVSAVERLEASATKEATGYWVEEEKKISRKNEQGELQVTLEKTKKWCRPNATVQIFLLSNWTHAKDYKGDKVYERDPSMTQIRREELEYKKENQEEW